MQFVTVNNGGWDHHAGIYDSLDAKLTEFDIATSALIEDLDTRGTSADTLLVILSEFGRSPMLNRNAGRDHWSQSSSLVFAGGGVKRGVVVGGTDRWGVHPAERPVTPADAAETILSLLGIDPGTKLEGAEGRPVPILDGGTMVQELIA